MGGGPSSVRLKHRLDLDAELDLLADQPATGLERLVPREAPLLAVDLRLGGKESALTAERVAHLPVVLGLQRDGPGYSTDGEIAVDLPVVVAVVFHTRARERQLRVRVDLEEVRAAQMIVALMLDCVGSSAMCSAPSNSPKRPLTLATIRCRTSNSTVVCAGSSTLVPALGNWTPFQVRQAPPVATACDMVSSSCRAGTASPAGLKCLRVQISYGLSTRSRPFSHTGRGRHGAPGAPRRPAPVPFPPGFGHDAGMSELHFPRHEYYMRLALREAQRQAHVVLVAGEVQFAHAGIMPETGGKRNRGRTTRRARRAVSSAARV